MNIYFDVFSLIFQYFCFSEPTGDGESSAGGKAKETCVLFVIDVSGSMCVTSEVFLSRPIFESIW